MTHQFRTYSITILTTFLCLLFINSCKKDKVEETIPYVPVNKTIYLNLPEFAPLNSVGNHVITDGGYRGIIVYRRSLTEFVAFDRACPHDLVAVTVDSSGIIAIDHGCGSQFSLYDGSVIHGPSTRSLQPYHADYDAGSSSVFIYN